MTHCHLCTTEFITGATSLMLAAAVATIDIKTAMRFSGDLHHVSHRAGGGQRRKTSSPPKCRHLQ